MATSYIRQLPQRDCLNLLVTCVVMPGETASYFPLPVGIDGITLTGDRINTYAGKPVRATTYHAATETTLHCFASPWAGYYYVAEYKQYRQRWECSCGGWLCDHIKFLRHLI